MEGKKLVKKSFYVTTPIYYVNDVPHIGHSYSTIIADTLVRYRRLAGYDCLFLTGTDEHGQKVDKAARDRGLSPQEHTDRMVEPWKELWHRLNVSYDDFIRTTQERHTKVVQSIFQQLYDNGDIYKGFYEGWYCIHEETFYPESQLIEGNCPECNRPVEWIKEESYYFKTSKYQDQLLCYIKEHPEFVQPDFRRNEVVSFIESGVQDISVSRTTFKWGIPIPFDPDHIVYVWFDALINYIAGCGYLNDNEKFEKFWPADVHIIGKDIIRFHCVIWPIMLMALGIALPKQVLAHGFWMLGGEKMSKSKGLVVDPIRLIDEYGADSIRYFLMREISIGLDGEFTEEALVRRLNSDLANDLGNLIHRTIAMMLKYYDGYIPDADDLGELEKQLKNSSIELIFLVDSAMMRNDVKEALTHIWSVIGKANKYIDESAPWVLMKEGKAKELDSVMRALLEAIRIITIMIMPIMPGTAEKIWIQLGQDDFDLVTLADAEKWGSLGSGKKVVKADPLFPRIELE